MCKCIYRSLCQFYLSFNFLILRSCQRQINNKGLTFFLERCVDKFSTCISWNYFQISPSKCFYFPQYILKHIELIHYFFCINFPHAIKFWSIFSLHKKLNDNYKSSFTCQRFWCCCYNNIIKTHLKGAFGFNGVFDIAFLFIEDIWNNLQKGSKFILSSIFFQIFAVYPVINDLVDLSSNLWCNNSKTTAIFLIANISFDFDICYISPNNVCFFCVLCGKVTTFFSLLKKYTMQNLLCNKQVFTKFTTIIIENILSHRSGAKSTLYNVPMKSSPYCCTFLFELVLFALLWRDVHKQLKDSYMYLLMSLG